MAIFNITNNRVVSQVFKTDNININIDTTDLTISKLQITYDEWLGN